MSQSLTRGLFTTALALAFGCGRVESARPMPAAPASAAGAAASATEAGGKATSTPPASGGTAAPTGQGGQDNVGGETTSSGGATLEQPCSGITALCQPGEA